MTDHQFIAELEACTLSPDRFHHAGHVHAAWIYLSRYPALEAIGRFCNSLRNFAASMGKPERYHETITWAYLLIVNERMQCQGGGENWDSFAAANPDLLDWENPILHRYYRKETLDSALARRVFLMPDATK